MPSHILNVSMNHTNWALINFQFYSVLFLELFNWLKWLNASEVMSLQKISINLNGFGLEILNLFYFLQIPQKNTLQLGNLFVLLRYYSKFLLAIWNEMFALSQNRLHNETVNANNTKRLQVDFLTNFRLKKE